MIVRGLMINAEERGKGRVSVEHLENTSIIILLFLSIDVNLLCLVTDLTNNSSLLKDIIFDPFKKWMVNCYRGLPLGGLG